jgi:hypothetical protein
MRTGKQLTIHLKAVKEIYIEKGQLKRRNRGTDQLGQYTTECGRISRGDESAIDLNEIWKDLKNDKLCQVCRAKAMKYLKEAKELKSKI